MAINQSPPAQASDEQAVLSKQLTAWRAEVARLNDLIAFASGVQASDEPLTKCAAYADGDCQHDKCPQWRHNEPMKSNRVCPISMEAKNGN